MNEEVVPRGRFLGFMAFAASGLANNRALGLLFGITILIALVADFLLLPTLLMALDRREL